MNRWQKIAWLNLIVVAITLVATTAAVIAFTFGAGMPWALHGLGFGGIVVLTLISPLVFRAKKKRQGEVIFDERDEKIHRRANEASDIASGALFLVVCMGGFFVVGLSGSIPVLVLPLMVCWAFVAGKLAYSVTILIQYGWRGKDGQ